ncbi:MAG: large conductance mechanosensitive channel protein MscL [Anaerolineales bacterium]|nr:large conductance mechanosensitive channel protein MscL [Anaerolineales bacterium]
MFKEFRTFIMRGNVIDLAIGIIIGAAFGRIITSLVNDIVMPPIGLLLGGVDFSNLYLNLSDTTYTSLAEAQEAGAATINYGLFFNAVLEFLIIALVIFLVIRQFNRLKREKEETPEPETTKECPYCMTTIPIKAVRCPNCISDLEVAAAAD